MAGELELVLETQVAKCPACHTQQRHPALLSSSTLWVRPCWALSRVRNTAEASVTGGVRKVGYPLTTF